MSQPPVHTSGDAQAWKMVPEIGLRGARDDKETRNLPQMILRRIPFIKMCPIYSSFFLVSLASLGCIFFASSCSLAAFFYKHTHTRMSPTGAKGGGGEEEIKRVKWKAAEILGRQSRNL